jgi:L-fuculose-phosphate aldolase
MQTMTPFDSLTPAEQIVTIMDRIYQNGMTTTSGGNLSVLAPGGDMWISPSGIDKGTLRPSDIMCVHPDGSISGPHKPSCEYPFHSGIFQSCRDVKAILHAHPPALVSFSIAGIVPDTAVFPRTKRLCGGIGFAPYDVPGSDALGRKISAVFAQGPRTVVLENHGVCLGGKSLLEAYLRFEALDFCARTIYQASLLGGAKPLTDARIQAYSEDKNTDFTEFAPGTRTSAELDLRETAAALVRRCVRQKLFTGASGSYAVRVDGERFLVTPADCDRANLQPDELVLIDGTKSEAGKTPDPRTWFFKAVFDAQPAVNAVCAANPPAIGAYLVSHAEFNPRVIPESFIQLRETPAFPFDAMLSEPETIARTLSLRHPVVLVQNDAVLTCGHTPLEAFDRLEVTEYSAVAAIAARSFGGLRPITDAQVEDLVTAFDLPRE